MTDETDWLRRYARDRSQESFRALVDRYIDVVYAAARRQVRDADLAQDVTQAVFLVLAEKADELARGGPDDRPLAGWLLKVTRYASSNAVRSRGRRTAYERRAAEMAAARRDTDATWDEYAPMLDEGLTRLRAADRDVLVLRFFDRKTAREVGEALNISEDAAEKRIARAVDKLRDFFRRRGVAVSSAALSAALVTNAAEAAPLGLGGTIAAGASSPAVAGSIAKGTLVAMASAKTKSVAAVIVGLLLFGGGAVAITSAIKSAMPRQVTVGVAATRPTSVPALPPLAITEPAPPPSVVKFGNGSTFEILGITDSPGRADRWWGPDGTPIVAPSPLPRAPSSPPPAGNFTYQVILRKADPPPPLGKEYNDFSWSVGLDGPQSTMSGIVGESSIDRLNHIFHTRDRATSTAALRITLAHAPFTEIIRIPLPAGGGAITHPIASPTSGPAKQPTLVVEKIADGRDGKAEVTLHFSPEHDRDSGHLDTTAILYDAQGKPHWYSGARYPSNLKDGVVYVGFDIAAKDAVAFEYRYRSWERHELRNVSLVPGRKTTPVLADPATPPAK